jgi:polysaccharide export outer membrane protein
MNVVKRTAFSRVLLVVVCAAIVTPREARAQSPSAAGISETSASVEVADSFAEWLHWTSGRYRITPGDVIEFKFPFVPELDQTVTVQPDGFISLQEIEDVRVQGQTVNDVKHTVRAAYETVVREPVFTVTLTQFEKPYFVASGQVKTPGRYELRGATTLTQALAFAGGTVAGADLSEVLLVRRHGDGVEVKEINVKHMLAKRDLSEDPLLRPGDMLVVGKSVIGKLSPILSVFRWGY